MSGVAPSEGSSRLLSLEGAEDGAHGDGAHSPGLAAVTEALRRVKHWVQTQEAGEQRGSGAGHGSHSGAAQLSCGSCCSGTLRAAVMEALGTAALLTQGLASLT